MSKVIVVGAGLGGMSAAITAAELGADVVLVEKTNFVGGAAAYSGGQVWVGANHVARRQSIEDDVESTLAYVRGAASRDPGSVDLMLAREWITAAAEAARYFEDNGVIGWEIIPDYPDYYYPQISGSRAAGRYLTGSAFDGSELGAHRERLRVSPHFPVGITYAEMFAWGGMSSRTEWDWDLLRTRRDSDILTFGTGVVGAFFKGVLARDVQVLLEHSSVRLLVADEHVKGVRCTTPEGSLVELQGSVILATGSHDWSTEWSRRFTGIPEQDGGSVAPAGVAGDALDLTLEAGGRFAALPSWAAPVLPGYRLPTPASEGDTSFRACFEHCLPHTFLVNSSGRRFADDSFHPSIVAAALGASGDSGPRNLPFFMVWDEQHHQKYGLGGTMPGGVYPEGLVATAPTIRGLAEQLGIPAHELETTTSRFNKQAHDGNDAEFGRGSNLSVRRFRGDWNNHPNPCLGPVEVPPFFGMRMRLLNTGIAAAGVSVGAVGRVLSAHGNVIPGLYAVGECSHRASTGVGYNSGYSLSRAMAYGYLAARDTVLGKI